MHTSCQQTADYQRKVIEALEEAPDINREWTEFELSTLRTYYGRKSIRAIATALGRSYASVFSRARRLGLSFEQTKGKGYAGE